MRSSRSIEPDHRNELWPPHLYNISYVNERSIKRLMFYDITPHIHVTVAITDNFISLILSVNYCVPVIIGN